MKTVLITGCSSGFGLAAARYFHEREWDVVATMRRPGDGDLRETEGLRLLPLNVANEHSIADAVAAAGPIDALVNNAGIGWLNALEGTSMAKIRELFDTNTFGTMALARAVVPQMRERKSGVIVNVSSSTTLLPMPFLSIYAASKAAINTFTEGLALELEPFGIRTRLVIPGQAPGTRFAATAQSDVAGNGGIPEPYAGHVRELFARHAAASQEHVTHAQDVAEVVWRAVTDPAAPLLLPAGADAVALSQLSPCPPLPQSPPQPYR